MPTATQTGRADQAAPLCTRMDETLMPIKNPGSLPPGRELLSFNFASI